MKTPENADPKPKTPHFFVNQYSWLPINITELLRIFTGKTQTPASTPLSPVMNLGLVRSLGLELCSITLLASAMTILRFRNKYQWSKLSCLGMVFLDLLRLNSLNVSCVVTLSQVHPTMILARLIWLRLPYAGFNGESIVNRLVRKLKRCFKEPVCFKIFYQTKKLSSFCVNKDPNPMYLKSRVIYNWLVMLNI